MAPASEKPGSVCISGSRIRESALAGYRYPRESNIRKRIDQDLQTAVSRLRQLGGVAGSVELAGAIGDSPRFADEVDESQATERLEICFATRELLGERISRLSAALNRLDGGEYGMCMECGKRISSVRLHALPEVETCIRCQDRLETLH
jgi:RNA polymerase-binding transcription factor DksA